MYLRYLGPSPAIEIPLPDGGAIVVERNHQFEVPTEFGRTLKRQESFEEVVKDNPKPDAKPANVKEA